MPEETIAVAEPSSAPVMEIERGALVNMTSEQRSEFRNTGKLPDTTPKEEAPAPSTTEETPSSETKPEGEVEEQPKPPQGRRKPDAEQRIKELTEKNKRIEAELQSLKKPAEPKLDTPKPADPPPAANAKPTAEDKNADGTPKYATYEDFVEALGDWRYEQNRAKEQRETQQQTQQRELKSKIDEAKQRYGEKFDEVLQPTVDAIIGDKAVNAVVKTMLNDSEVLPDLLFTIGSDPKELSSFLEMATRNPGKALRYIALTESLIRGELESKPVEAPAPPRTAAPKPPAEVGGRAAAPADAVEEAAKSGDFARYKEERTRRDLARLTGRG